MDNSKKFDELIVLLSKISDLRNTKGQIFKAFDAALKSLVKAEVSAIEFESFLMKMHDRFVKYDSVFRIYGFRALRHLTRTAEHVRMLHSRGIHYIVIESLERDTEYLHERMQAIRLVRQAINVSPPDVGLAVVRSLVAVASELADKFRRVAIDTLCDLAIKNPCVVAEANGMRTLFDLMLQPDCVETIQPIVVSLLFLYNSPETRRHVQFETNLGALLSPFTDFDSSSADFEQRQRSARVALVTFMRSWGGLHALSQGEVGLRSLSKLLCDSKVSSAIQEVILDMIGEVLEPVISRNNAYTKPNKLSGLKKLSTQHLRRSSETTNNRGAGGVSISVQRGSTGSSLLLPRTLNSDGPSSRGGPSAQKLDSRVVSDRPGSRLSVDDADDDDELSQSSGGSAPNRRGRSRSSSQAILVPPKPPLSEHKVFSESKMRGNGANDSSAEKIEPRRSLKSFLLNRSKTSSPKRESSEKHKGPTASTAESVSSPEGEISPKSIFRAPRSQHRRASDNIYGETPGDWTGKNEEESSGRIKSSTIDLGFNSNWNSSSVSLGFLLNGCSDMDLPALERTFSVKALEEIERPRGEPLFNLLDTYAVMLCAALLRSGFFPALCTLGTLGTAMLSDKARKTLVHLLGVIARHFPDKTCAQLLSDPSLIEFASTFASLKLSDRALKASQMLLSLSSAFSLSRGRGGYTATSIVSNAANRKIVGMGNGSLLDNITGASFAFSVGALKTGDSSTPAKSTNATNGSSSSNDVLASRIREHRVTRVISDVLDEIAHTAFSRVSRIAGTAGALKDNNPEAFKNRHVRGKSDADKINATTRGTLSSFVFGDGRQNTMSAMMQNDNRSSISSELLATPVTNVDKGGQTREDLMYEIKIVVTPLVDKGEFSRQMDLSRVVGKEGKEPFKWDWSMISEMLEYCVRYPARLQEAMKTKWVKRISGFFRCSSDDKGYFSNLDWYPSNLHYLECACHLYGVLVEQENVQTPFLGTDRRGMLFAEIVGEIEYLGGLASRIAGSQPVLASSYPAGFLVANNASPATSRSVFRLFGCTQLMSREFFALVGRLCGTQAGRTLVEGNQIFSVLSTLGQHACLDYLSRVALTSISFTDQGFMSQNMLQILPVSVGSSDSMKIYSHILLRSLLRSRDPQSNSWMVETLSAQLLYDNMPTASVIRVLEEIVQDGAYIKMLSKSLNQLITIPEAEPILIRLLSASDGLEQLQKFKWIVPNIKKWLIEGGCLSYSDVVESSLFDALCVKHSPVAIAQKADYVPIPVACRPYSVHPQAPRRFSWYPDGGADIEGMLRAPWNIECRIGAQPAGQRGSTKDAPPDYVRIDSYLDASDMPSAASGETTSDELRIIKVRGVIIDDKGLPSGIVVPADRILSACLLCGVCPVYRDGRVYADPSQTSGVGNLSSMGYAGLSTAANPTMSSTASVMTQRRRFVRNSDSSGGIFNDRNSSAGSVQENVDPPLTYHTEHLQDWSYCKPAQRQTMVHQREIGGGRICVEVPGDPVCWIFSKTNPCPLANTRSDSIGGVGANGVNGKVHDVVASGLESISLSQRLAQERKSSVSGVLYLVEVHFMLKLITGDPTIVPMRRHMFGEMGRTLLGCKLLEEEGVIASLLAEASLFSDVIKTGEDDVSFTHIDIPHSGSAESLLLFDEPAECETTEVDRPVTLATEQATVHRIKAAVWALGHLGSTDNGFEALLRQDPNFVAWCVDMVQSSSYFSLRSVCFSALGLLSRSDKSKEVFAQLGWDCSTNHCSAVAIPNDLSRMFKSQASETQDNLNMSPVLASDGTTPIKGAHRVNREHLYNLISEVVDPEKRELYCDVLECIAKLPGHILYKDIKSRLAKMQLVHPDLFADRALYLATHQVLLLFSFNLTIRRHIFSLFHSDARLSV